MAMNTRFVLFLLPVVLLSNLIAQQLPDDSVQELGNDQYVASTWIVFHDNMTKSEAKEKATAKALKSIIEYYSGIEISSSSFSMIAESGRTIGIDHFAEVTNTLSKGMILEKEVIEGRVQPHGNQTLYVIKVRAKVGSLKGEKDPLFILDANLNRDIYQNGDEMVININSSKKCFVYVFNVYSDGTVATLIPNTYLPGNMIEAGGVLRIPPLNEKSIKFRVGIPEGVKSASELIYVLGIKNDEQLSSKTFDLNFDSYKMAIEKLTELVMEFPRDQIEQITLNYVIESRD
jgi:hypothetical protein